MGFVGNMLGNIENIQFYYIIGLFIFIGLFITILVRTLRMKKSDVISIKTSIIDEGETLESIHS